MRVRLVTIGLMLVLVLNIHCGEYYKLDGRSYYLSHPLTKNFYQALRFCNRIGMYLIDIRTEAENIRILSLIERFRNQHNTTQLIYWTSGSDLGSEGNYYWMTTGEELLFTHWAGGSPDNYRVPSTNETEDCLVIQGFWDNMWNDGACSSSYPFICRDVYDVATLKSSRCSIGYDEL